MQDHEQHARARDRGRLESARLDLDEREGHRAPIDPTRGVTDTRTIELREEQLVPVKDWRDVGEVIVRTQVEDVPGRVEVEAFREEVEVQHEPIGQYVSERVDPWQEGDELVVPVYEEQLVVSKRLVLREHLRIRRVRTSETQVFEQTLQRERLVIEDPASTGLVHEQYPAVETSRGETDDESRDRQLPPEREREREEGGLLQNLVRKALE